jgi:hypothetical protein
MSSVVRQLLLPLCTSFVLVWVLLAWDPFRVTRDLAIRLGGPVREDAMVTNLYRNTATQEITNGAAPLQGLNQLASAWCTSANDLKRFILLGNSQTFTMLLAPSEPSSDGVQRTYLDQLLQQENTRGRSVLGYRLSAPNLSYPEVLWYLHYILTRPCMEPDRIIIQLNYESFRKVGIRDGMLELLADPAFAAAIRHEAEGSSAYTASFRQAMMRYGELSVRTRSAAAVTLASGASTGTTGIVRGFRLGTRLETSLRGVLARSASFRNRPTLKDELLTTLYLLRVNVLGITPTTKRSLGGVALAMSVSALDRVGQLCGQNHIKLEFFLAPQNPRASLYRTSADLHEYQRITDRLIHRYAWRSVDLEDIIPANEWGIWIDGPDPIHFGRAAHARMAQYLMASGLIPDGS